MTVIRERTHVKVRRVCAALICATSVLLGPAAAPSAIALPMPPSGCQFLPGGLRAWWPADGSALDQGGTNNGTLVNGASFVAGRVGQAFHFDGVNDYVQVGARPSLKMGAAMTVAAWIRPTANVDGIIVSKEGEYEIAREPDGTIQWALANPATWLGQSNWLFINTHAVAPLNVWTHVALVYDSTKVTTFVNGVAVHSVGGSVPPGNTGTLGDVHTDMNDFRIGGRQHESEFFAGDIDEVEVWDQPVPAADVAALATTGLAGEHVQVRPTTRIDFDTLPNGGATTLGQVIDNEYATLGVTFSLDTGAPAIIANTTFPGGARALSPTADGSLTPSKMRDIVMNFSVPVARVSIASGDTDEPWSLRAYAGDSLVASGSPMASGDIAVATAVATTPATGGWITRAVVDLTQANTEDSGPEFFDLLQFDVADATAPTVTLTAPPANAAGWNNGPVTVALTSADGGGAGLSDFSYESSGATEIAMTHATGSASLLISDDGITTVSYAAVDCQGNQAVGSQVVRVDATPPSVLFTGNLGSYGVADDVGITCVATDATSGIATNTCTDAIAPAWSFGVGEHTLVATATDVAGNESTESTSFVVVVDTAGLCRLVQQFAGDSNTARSLCAKLSNADAAKTPQARAGMVNAFRNEVAAQSGKTLRVVDAATLRSLASSL